MTFVKGGLDLPKRANRDTAPFQGGPEQPYISTQVALGVCACAQDPSGKKESTCSQWGPLSEAGPVGCAAPHAI